MPISNNLVTKIPGPTQGSKIFCSSLICPSRDIIYSAVFGGVRTTPNSLLLNSIPNQHFQFYNFVSNYYLLTECN